MFKILTFWSVPISLLIDEIVFGFVICFLLAASPTKTSSPLKDTTDGTVLLPSGFSSTIGFLFSITDTHEFVVPKSIPKMISAGKAND